MVPFLTAGSPGKRSATSPDGSRASGARKQPRLMSSTTCASSNRGCESERLFAYYSKSAHLLSFLPAGRREPHSRAGGFKRPWAVPQALSVDAGVSQQPGNCHCLDAVASSREGGRPVTSVALRIYRLLGGKGCPWVTCGLKLFHHDLALCRGERILHKRLVTVLSSSCTVSKSPILGDMRSGDTHLKHSHGDARLETFTWSGEV